MRHQKFLRHLLSCRLASWVQLSIVVHWWRSKKFNARDNSGIRHIAWKEKHSNHAAISGVFGEAKKRELRIIKMVRVQAW